MDSIRVAAKAVIIEDGCLLAIHLAHKNGDWYGLPGGGQEPGETLHDSLRRECLEEIGVGVVIHDILFVRDYMGKNHEFADTDSDVHQVEVMFACTLAGSERPRVGAAPDTDQLGVEWLELASCTGTAFTRRRSRTC